MKAIYRHKTSGDIFAIETDEQGKVLSTSGPLLVKDLNPSELDYDNYWDKDVKTHLAEFVLLSKAEYEELLKEAGFFIQESQRSIFEELERRNNRHPRRLANKIVERKYNMKISIESPTRIKLIPEADHEKESLEALWKLIIRCDEDSKVLCPIGAYIPSEDDGASFVIQDQ